MKSPCAYLYLFILRKHQTYINFKSYSLIARSLSQFRFKSALFPVHIEGRHSSSQNAAWGQTSGEPAYPVPHSPRQWQLRAGWKLGGDSWLRQAQDDEPALNLAFKPHCRSVIHGFTKAFVDPVYAPSQYNLSGKQVPDVD